MKKLILLSAISLTLLSCKKENEITYKYANNPQTLTCEDVNSKLYSEAYYTFENAAMIYAKNTSRRPNAVITPENAIRTFLARSKGNLKIENYVTEQSLIVFKKLKTLDIWTNNHLKNNSALTECIGQNISNKDLRLSFNTLRSVESLDPKIMSSAIYDNRTRSQYKDKVLMTYVALDMYYAKFFNLDLFKVIALLGEQKEPLTTTPKPNIEKRKIEVKKEDHTGHNH